MPRSLVAGREELPRHGAAAPALMPRPNVEESQKPFAKASPRRAHISLSCAISAQPPPTRAVTSSSQRFTGLPTSL